MKYEFNKVGNTRILTGTKEEKRALRKERRAQMTIEDKLSEFFSVVVQICTLFCCIAGVVAITEFLEGIIHLDGIFFDIILLILLCLTGGGLCIIPQEREESLKKEIKNLTYYLNQRDEAIMDAVHRRDISVLIPLCDPEWVDHTRKTSGFWYEDRLVLAHYTLKRDIPFSSEMIGKLDPYKNKPIETESDYEAYLWALAKEQVDQSDDFMNYVDNIAAGPPPPEKK